ncbi:YjdJ family protein [Bacillus tianshenii]|uniref:YjdJ family protein n=1 Tax=Sutcliffiella tianshenii TaxID=1463404 RepID=UPI001CD66F82|nr:YjdJ family protein [Bacillus tianshenii]MCA1322193.1 YjdJ family protein [Bacillus tianshenii]
MRVGSMVAFCLAVMLFGIATFASWYEGSDLVERPFEWDSTAKITSWWNHGAVERENISQLDYFIYSLKYKPLFPILMLISFVYILFAVGKRWMKGKGILSVYSAGIAVMLFCGAMLVGGSPTEGGKLMMAALIVSGGLLTVYASFNYLQLTRNIER